MEAAGSTVIVVETTVVARSERRNVLATSMRTRRMTLEEALAAASVADKMLDGLPREVDTGSVLELAERSGCTSYDCEFVSVALDLGVPLVTSDWQVLAAFPEVAVSPEAFVAQ